MPPDLIADIGGTNIRFALVRPGGAAERIAALVCADYPDPAAALEAYLSGVTGFDPPRRAVLAVAAPVTGDRIRLTNHPWDFSIDQTRRRFDFERLDVINDFSAIAFGLPHLPEDARHRIGGGIPVEGAPLAVLGPGTGLGVSGLLPARPGWVPLAGEGGHVTMAAADDRESAVLATLRGNGHVSAEHVLSGRGLVRLHRTLGAMEGADPEPLDPAEITARAGAESCPICAAAWEMFCAMLGTVAADLALTLGARGGVFIAGGIVPRHVEMFAATTFRRRFEAKAIPTYVITHEQPAFVGLSQYLANQD
ncbi:MAG: glucokinase [Alphaproteobacteria bacterium]